MTNQSIICQACLSNGRELFCVGKLQNILIKEELFNPNNGGGVCWECRRTIEKFTAFRNQVALAQKTLHESENVYSLKCLSSLSHSKIHIFDCQNIYLDPLNSIIDADSIPKIIKDEIEILKEESDFHDECPIENETNVYIEETVLKKEVQLKKKEKVIKSKKKKLEHKIHSGPEDCSTVKQKFIEVEFTEEEMLRNREEKRKHPNFKKLPYNCDTCVLGFTRKETFELHKEKKHNESIGKHMCPVCQIRLTSPAALTKHVKKHYHCYQCKFCAYETTELWSALSHCRSKHSEDTEDSIHCPQCRYIARTREELAEHVKAQHSLICNECGEKFKGPNTLKTHIRRIHGTPREHRCDSCPRGFRSRGRLEAHMAGHGAAAAARLAYCATCRVQYKNIYVYRNHLSTSANHSEKRYHCEVCNKKFASKVYYKRHYTFYHQKSSPFKCEQCNRLFISDWRLRNHRQMRHDLARTRNHACNICGKKFFTTSTLKAHQLTHSAQRTFMCEDCGDTFKQRPALYTHARLVHRGLKRQNTYVTVQSQHSNVAHLLK